ncbi:GH25 family lysozyme [Enterococcus dongliensis]|uniref:GH25 family lysozyme n=1 Tax=Enterococcus dongliensis TaxID=2559925 RepID=UPI00288D66D9|nr:GH25 family lysozyme [Enterococcus dongliensis]MDT2669161.1 GH25 family lysozyme [Enterococcus dongliensis]
MVLNGIDIASWQSGINVGANGVAADFVIIKATGGTGYVNPDCDRAFQQAIKSGKKVAVYHYAHELGFQGTAQQEAEFFLKNVQGYIGKAILVLDWESDNKGDVAWAKAWLDHVQSKTGVKPLFYTYTAVLNSYNFSSIANADYGLWVANYGSDSPQGYSQPNPPASPYWKSTAMYQYTSNGRLNGWNGRLDLNVFYGDKKTWDAYAGIKSSGSTQKLSTPAPSKPNPAPTPQGKKNGIAIDNVSKDQATKIVQRVQTNYAWTLLRDKVKAVKQKDGRYTLSIRTGRGKRQEQTRARLSQELKSYYPGYIQSNVALVNGDKDSATLEARNMPASAFTGKNPFDVHMRNFLKDILLDGQTYAEANAYGTYDVRIKGEGFNDHDVPIVLKQIQDLGKAKDLKINPSHIKGFKY